MGCGGIIGAGGFAVAYASAMAGFSTGEIATLQTVMFTNASGKIIGFGIQVMGEVVAYEAAK